MVWGGVWGDEKWQTPHHSYFKGKYNIFRTLYGVVLEHINEDIRFVEAYANKKNTKTIGILEKLGLSIIGENKNGISYHFRGTYVI